ncbi:MAG: sigma-70 family RNA polymerase sigma factor [Patescibacteria group bacterium]
MNDAELIAAYLAGDEGAFATLTGRHLAAAYSFALRFVGEQHEAEDIVQESFVKVWQNLKRYNKDSASFKTWLMRIVRNTCVDHLRKRKHVPFSAFEDTEGEGAFANVPTDSPLADELFSKIEDVAELQRALGQLPAPYREVLLLYYGEDMTFEEVADALGASVNTVKSRHRRAMHRLRQHVRI